MRLRRRASLSCTSYLVSSSDVFAFHILHTVFTNVEDRLLAVFFRVRGNVPCVDQVIAKPDATDFRKVQDRRQRGIAGGRAGAFGCVIRGICPFLLKYRVSGCS
jgi:hypothetical protein